MNKLSELIRELCPDGVAFKKLKEVYDRVKGTPITAAKMKEIADDSGDIRIFAGGKTVINAKEENIPNANITRVPAVLVQSRGVIDVVYYDKPFTFKNEMWAYTTEEIISVKFLYYVLKNSIQAFRDAASGMGSLPQISLPVTEEFLIPVPPIEVQREIVRILDKFTTLSAELSAELSAKLSARKKQYDSYREKILAKTNNAEQYALQDIVADSCSISYGIVQTGDDVEKGIPVVRPVDLVDRIVSLSGLKRVAPSIAEPYKRTVLKGGDLLLCVRGTTGLISIASDELKGCNVSRGIVPLTFKSTVCPRYIYYQFLSQGIQKEIESKTRGTALRQINMEDLRRIRFPVPALEVQQQIADTLDRFDTFCNDLSSGLPAEIEARQKQYEYYRDKLLSFKPLA